MADRLETPSGAFITIAGKRFTQVARRSLTFFANTSVPAATKAKAVTSGFQQIPLTSTQAMRICPGSCGICSDQAATPSGFLSVLGASVSVLNLPSQNIVRSFPFYATSYILGNAGCTGQFTTENDLITMTDGQELNGPGTGLGFDTFCDVANSDGAAAHTVTVSLVLMYEIWELAPDSFRA